MSKYKYIYDTMHSCMHIHIAIHSTFYVPCSIHLVDASVWQATTEPL